MPSDMPQIDLIQIIHSADNTPQKLDAIRSALSSGDLDTAAILSTYKELLQDNQSDDALLCLRLGHQAVPSSIGLHLALTRRLLAIGQYEEARIHIDQILLEHPDHLPTRLTKAHQLELTGDTDAAIVAYDSIPSDAEQYMLAQTKVAGILVQTQRYQNALTRLDAIVNLSPDYTTVKLYHAIYQGLHLKSAAAHKIQLILEAVDFDERLFDLLLHWSMQIDMYALTGRIYRLHQSAIDKSKIRRRLLQYYLAMGDPPAAINLAQSCIEDYPDDAQIAFHWMQIQLNIGCTNALHLKITQHPDWANRLPYQLLSAEAHCMDFAYSRARLIYEGILDQDPSQSQALRRLAMLDMLDGHVTVANERMKTAAISWDRHKPSASKWPPLFHYHWNLLNDMRIDPTLCALMDEMMKRLPSDRIRPLAHACIDHPWHLGLSILFIRTMGELDLLHTPTIDQAHAIGHPANLTIVQYWDNPKVHNEIVIPSLSWTTHHPDAAYHRFNHITARAFIAQHLDENHLTAFDQCASATEEADYFRLIYLYIHGGLYADVDDFCLRPTAPICSHDLVVVREEFSTIGNHVLYCRSGHPVLANLLDRVTQLLTSYSKLNAWLKTGPALWTCAIAHHLALYYTSHEMMAPDTRVLDQSTLRHYVYPHLPLSYKRSNRHWLRASS